MDEQGQGCSGIIPAPGSDTDETSAPIEITAAPAASEYQKVSPSDEDLEAPTWSSLQAHARVAQLYFGRRRAWFETCGRFSRMITLLFSSGAVINLVSGYPAFSVFLSIVTALVSIVTVAFDFSGQQKRYEDAYRQITNFLSDVTKNRLSSNQWETRLKLQNDYDQIASLEIQTFEALSILCLNQLRASEGSGEDTLYHVPLYQRLTCQVIPWRGPYPTQAERRQARG